MKKTEEKTKGCGPKGLQLALPSKYNGPIGEKHLNKCGRPMEPNSTLQIQVMCDESTDKEATCK